MIDLEKAKNEFIKYTNNYDLNDPNIDRKKFHSLRVMENSKKIAENSGLNEEQIQLATLIGLLHDVARFDQWTNFHSFSDRKTIDHGNDAIRILENNNFIRKFVDTDKYDEIIKKAIRNHNKYKIEDELKDEELIQAKIIRDADKLDIFYEWIENMFLESEEKVKSIEESTISEDYFNQFLNEVQIFNKPNQSPLDIIISTLAFIFDLNFKYSLQVVQAEDYINKILNKFNFKNSNTIEQINKIKEISNNFLNKKI